MGFQATSQTLVIFLLEVDTTITAAYGCALGVVPEIHQIMPSCTDDTSRETLFLSVRCETTVPPLDFIRNYAIQRVIFSRCWHLRERTRKEVGRVLFR
jgi:hypothetical protein